LDNNKNIPVEESRPKDGLEGTKYTRYIVNDHGEIETSKIKPTWVIPHPDGKRLFVAGNGINRVYEIDLKSWSIVRSFPTGKGPYNIEISPDGKYLVATYKSEGYTGVWDLDKGEEVTKIKNTREVTHGVAISDDSKIAFVTVEGRKGEPGAVDIIDLESMKKVAAVDVGKQAGGVVFLKQE
jgi:DNA-binding beta-propeller fold protein YncE